MKFFTPKPDRRGDDAAPDPGEVLADACDRNVPICVVRPDDGHGAVMARGRMLRLLTETVQVEQLRLPGRVAPFRVGDDLEAHFTISKTRYAFRSSVWSVREVTNLNSRKLIAGMSITRPGVIEAGERRNAYRVPVGAREDRIAVEVWKLGKLCENGADGSPDADGGTPDADEARMDDEVGGMTSFALNPSGVAIADFRHLTKVTPDYAGWLTDGTEHGYGVLLEFVRPERFRVFEPLLLRITLPGERQPMVQLAEVRSKRPVGDECARLGLVTIPDADPMVARTHAREMRKVLTEIEREQIRRVRRTSA